MRVRQSEAVADDDDGDPTLEARPASKPETECSEPTRHSVTRGDTVRLLEFVGHAFLPSLQRHMQLESGKEGVRGESLPQGLRMSPR